jgi:hypothetical protein
MTMGRIRDRFRKKVRGIIDFFSTSIVTGKSATQRFGSQRMCPFCNLITPRSGRFCLECGKSFANT